MFLYLRSLKDAYESISDNKVLYYKNKIKLYSKLAKFRIYYKFKKLDYLLISDFNNWIQEYIENDYISDCIHLKRPFNSKVNIEYHNGYDFTIICRNKDNSKFIFNFKISNTAHTVEITTSLNGIVTKTTTAGKNKPFDQHVYKVINPLLMEIYLALFKEMK